MNKLLSCHYNMDTNRVEARFKGGTILAIGLHCHRGRIRQHPGTAGRTGLAAVQ